MEPKRSGPSPAAMARTDRGTDGALGMVARRKAGPRAGDAERLLSMDRHGAGCPRPPDRRGANPAVWPELSEAVYRGRRGQTRGRRGQTKGSSTGVVGVRP